VTVSRGIEASLAVTVLAAAVAVRGGGQDTQRCQVRLLNVDREGTSIEVTPGITNYFAGGNVRFRCANLPVFWSADSVASYQGRILQFIGSFRYRDTAIEMQADFGTYLRDGEKWEARGAVALRNVQEGSTLRGPMLDYYRAARGVRDTTEMFADQRPTITMPVKDSGRTSDQPYVIVGDRVRTRGGDRVWAGGRVTVDRSDFQGRGDSLTLDTGAGNAGALIGTASMQRTAADSFRLTGQRIDLTLAQRELVYVTSRDSARLTSDNLRLEGDGIGLDVSDGEIEQTLAWGTVVRPWALSGDYEARGDSLAFDTPGRTLREIRGFGNAWLGARPDSIGGDRDWISGDTVRAAFAVRDSAVERRPVLRLLEARGGAKSFYRMRQPGQPGLSINYSRAKAILLVMRQGDTPTVDSVSMVGDVEGMHLQPGPVRADSAAADTARVDTTRVAPARVDTPLVVLRRPGTGR
jgi:hypothetical protein